jgi:hypothetical protein
MHLWRSGEVGKVDEFLDTRGLRRSAVFHQLLQALIELAERGSEERALLESLSNHISARGPLVRETQADFRLDSPGVSAASSGSGEEG